jgi:hypothetical protein
MAQAPLAETVLAGGRILFELERFELADRDRLEVSGRWFGVRGRRFVRPTLTLMGNGERARVLADLDHKPWTAEDGEAWTAAFPVDPGGGAVDEVELAVAPDIAISLPAPTPLRTRGNGRTAGGAPRRRRPTGTDGTVVAAHGGSASDGAALPAAQRELVKMRARLEDERREMARLRHELEQTGATKAEISAALSRRDAAMRKFERAATRSRRSRRSSGRRGRRSPSFAGSSPAHGRRSSARCASGRSSSGRSSSRRSSSPRQARAQCPHPLLAPRCPRTTGHLHPAG